MFEVKFANMHLHSTYSDGGFTPNQLVLIGKSVGYGALVLTDHETDAGNAAFARAAKREGIETLTGVEFYGQVNGVAVHLTALDFDPDEPTLRAFIKKRCDLQYERTKKITEMGIANGFLGELTWNDVVDVAPEGAWLCIDSVLTAIRVKKKIPPQGTGGIRANVFKTPEAKALKAPSPEAEEVISVVRKAGGVIALAHPNQKMLEQIDTLVGYGLNGIEIDHPSIHEEDLDAIHQAAEQYHLYHCGGTDHTGPLSACGGDRAIPVFNGITEEEFFLLKERRLG